MTATNIEPMHENNSTQNTDPLPALLVFYVTSKSDINIIGEIKNCVNFFFYFTDSKIKMVHFLSIQNLVIFYFFSSFF